MVSSGPDPFACHGDEAEDELLQPEVGFQPGELFGIFSDQVVVKVGIQGRHKHKGGIFC